MVIRKNLEKLADEETNDIDETIVVNNFDEEE